MKTPNKIYIAERNAGFTDIVDMMWTYEKRSDPAVTNVEYIRKEAILKWIEEVQQKQDLHKEYDAGVYDCLEELIEHIK